MKPEVQYASILDLQQETELHMAERDWAYRMMWDELKYGQFASAHAYAEDYSALATQVAFYIEGGE